MRKIILVLLAAVLAGRAWGGDGNAKVVKIAGKAEILRAGVWNEIRERQAVAPGESVRVSEPGEVVVEAEGGKIGVSGKNGAVIEYDGLVDADIVPWRSARVARAPGGQPAGTARLTQQFSCPVGEIDVRVLTGQPLRVVTPLLTAAVRGTRFSMRVAEDGSSSVLLREGSIDGFDRTGAVRRIAPGEGMSLASDAFVRHLGSRGVRVAPGQDWRALAPGVLDAVDNSAFSGRFSQVYYNPVVNRVVKSDAGLERVDEARVAWAAYVGGATLDEVLANPDANPFAPEWLEALAERPLNERENGFLDANYHPERDGGFDGGRGQGGIGGGPRDSSLIEGGTPRGDIAGFPGNTPSGFPEAPSGAPSLPSSSGNAIVKGNLGGSGVNGGSFGFNLDLGSGAITNGRLNGSGVNAGTRIGFGMGGGSGAYDSGTKQFSVGGFTSGNVNGNANLNPANKFDGAAPSGLGQRGDPVSGGFSVIDPGSGKSLTGTIDGKRVK